MLWLALGLYVGTLYRRVQHITHMWPPSLEGGTWVTRLMHTTPFQGEANLTTTLI